MFDNLGFIILPYGAVLLAVVMTIYRYRNSKFSYSSLSSQFLESGELFFGSVPWHFGVLAILAGHLIGFLIPAQVLWFNSVPVRLYVLEGSALLFGLLCLVGIVSLIMRRMTAPRIRAVTSTVDVLVLALLLIQVLLGVYTALFYRWGSSWYATSVVPYLRSLFVLQPDMRMIAPLPTMVKLHIVNAFVLVGILPFSRLVHMLVVPLQYLWRPYQLVVWNSNRKTLRPRSPWLQPQPADAPKAVTGERTAGGRQVVTR